MSVQSVLLRWLRAASVLFVLITRLQAEPGPPALELIVPAPGENVRELFSVEVHFNEAVQGVDAADLTVNGVPSLVVSETVQGQFIFAFEQPPDGLVRVEWEPNHGIIDLDDPAESFAGGSWTYQLGSVEPAPGLYISEFMADNRRTLNDEDGESEDWIEIHNPNENGASLAGWFLTDTTNNLALWQFPEIMVPGRSYLVVFASQKNRTNINGKLHANFRLREAGDYLALVDPRTNIISEYAPVFPEQFTDVSYGRLPGGNEAGYFATPTPGKANAIGGPAFAPDVEFSLPSGPFTLTARLELTTALANAQIRYTVNGLLPTNTSTLYTGAIEITNSMAVRARAYVDGLLPGRPRSEAYLFLSNNIVNWTSTLPVLVLHSLGRGAPNGSRPNFVQVSVHEPIDGVTRLTDEPVSVVRAGVKTRGSSTGGLPKASYALEIWDEFDADKDIPLLGLPEESDWVLYAPNSFDPIMIHNPFIHQLSRDMGMYSPRTRFVEIFFNKGSGLIASNHYGGIYVLEEKIKIGKNRVEIDKLEREHVKDPQVTGGYLLKIDRLDPGDGGYSGAGATVAFIDPKESELETSQQLPQRGYIQKYLSDYNRALTSANWKDPNAGYAAFFDVDTGIDFHVLEVLSGNVDAMVLSTYFHKPRGGKITFGPHWDFDRALGSTDGRDSNPRVWQTGPFFSSAWWSRMFRDPLFWQKWVDRWQDLRTSHFSLTNLHGLIDRQTGELREAQPRETAKWRTAFRGAGYQGEINHMKNWVSNRVSFIDGQFTKRPVLSRPAGIVNQGETITLTSTNTVYYTLDGSDPRLREGLISPSAIQYSGPIAVTENVRITARAYNLAQRQSGGPPISTPWSGPVAATYYISVPKLLITELMYHPAPAPEGVMAVEEDFEFIELLNADVVPVQLNGFSFTNGLFFTFTATSDVQQLAPGGRLLLVKNKAAFLTRYPGAANIAGEFTGSLANEGNRIAFVGPRLEPILDFSYEDDWEPLSDGPGYSLVIRDETLDREKLGSPDSWRLSAKEGGSPGLGDGIASPVLPVLIKRVLSHPKAGMSDMVELLNPNSEDVDIGGWYLSDDFATPRKLRLPSPFIVPAGKTIQISLTQFGAFGLQAGGDDIYLFSADPAGSLTGFFHGFEFGAAPEGVAFGRFLTSDGQEHLVLEGCSNENPDDCYPLVGPVVVSEIRPGVESDGSIPFVELQNVTTRPVGLFESGNPANTWRLRGSVDFDFPSGLVMPASGRLVLVAFDPARQNMTLARFRSRYGLAPDAKILGPWSGELKAAGVVRLLQPGAAENAFEDPPAYLVDEIVYGGTGWPNRTAGQSYERTQNNKFGNDPGHWAAVWPSAGDEDSDGDGLPNRWETASLLDPFSSEGLNGGDGDPDNDGVSNRVEFHTATGAQDPASRAIVVPTRTANGIRLRFTVQEGRSYSIVHKSDLSSAWRVIQRVIPAAGSGTQILEHPATTFGFYAIQVP